MTQSAGSAVKPQQPAPERPRKPCRFRTFLLGALLFMFVTLVGACWWPLKYTTVAKFERRSDAASEDLVRGKSASFDAIKMTLQQELVGTRAIEAAVDELEMERLLPADVLAMLACGRDPDDKYKLTSEGRRLRQDLVRRMQDNLKVAFEVRSPEVDLISVTFTDPDPRLAQQLPNTLITNYINRISEQIVTNLTSSRDFLKVKVDEANTRLSELTYKRINFEVKHAGMLPENPGVLAQEVQKVSSDMDTVRWQQALAKQKLDQIRAMLGRIAASKDDAATAAVKPKVTPVEIEGDAKTPEVAALKKQLRETEEQLADARTRVAELEARVKELAGAPTGLTFSETANLPLQETAAQSEYQMASNQLERLQARLVKLQESLSTYGPVRYEYLGILKEVADQQAEVDRWQKRLTEVQMALAAEAAKRRTHLTQVELAQEQFLPESPKLLDVLAIAILGGLAFGTVWVLLFWRVRLGGLGRILLTFGNVILLSAVAVALLNITLWLIYPRDEYVSWKNAPVSYVSKGFSDWAQ